MVVISFKWPVSSRPSSVRVLCFPILRKGMGTVPFNCFVYAQKVSAAHSLKCSMEVVTNYFHQVSPSGSGHFRNSLVLSTTMPNNVIFNNISYNCRWGQTTDRDGQWQEITLSFCRRSRGSWPTEHYVRVSKDLYILQYRRPSDTRHRASADGIFYDVPLKILRCLTFSRSASSPLLTSTLGAYVPGGPETTIYGHYSQLAYEATGDISASGHLQGITDWPASISAPPGEREQDHE